MNRKLKFNQSLRSSPLLGSPKQKNKGQWVNPFPMRFSEAFVLEELKKWHLVREEEKNPLGNDARMIPEVYLTRLLSTKVRSAW